MKRCSQFVVANWKLNPPTIADAKKLFVQVKKSASSMRGVRIVICPPTLYLAELRKFYVGRKIAFGAQDVFWETSGSHTGEIAPSMIKSVGGAYVIVGHSERRARGETNEMVQKKVLAALAEKLTVVLCIGEKERDKNGEYLSFLKEELNEALVGVEALSLKRIVIAYEPIWAIGKSAVHALTPERMHEMSLFIRKVLTEKYDKASALSVPVLYGGSVEPGNADALLANGDIDGFLVGHASLDATSFSSILEITDAAR